MNAEVFLLYPFGSIEWNNGFYASLYQIALFNSLKYVYKLLIFWLMSIVRTEGGKKRTPSLLIECSNKK
jgi:hypothetical protein